MKKLEEAGVAVLCALPSLKRIHLDAANAQDVLARLRQANPGLQVAQPSGNANHGGGGVGGDSSDHEEVYDWAHRR